MIIPMRQRRGGATALTSALVDAPPVLGAPANRPGGLMATEQTAPGSKAVATAAAGASLVLFTLSAGQFLMALDTSVMNISIANPALSRRPRERADHTTHTTTRRDAS